MFTPLSFKLPPLLLFCVTKFFSRARKLSSLGEVLLDVSVDTFQAQFSEIDAYFPTEVGSEKKSYFKKINFSERSTRKIRVFFVCEILKINLLQNYVHMKWEKREDSM